MHLQNTVTSVRAATCRQKEEIGQEIDIKDTDMDR